MGALRAHLVAVGSAAGAGLPRESSLASYRLFAARDPRQTCGLDPEGAWSPQDLLRLMADRCGVSPDPEQTCGAGRDRPGLHGGGAGRLRGAAGAGGA